NVRIGSDSVIRRRRLNIRFARKRTRMDDFMSTRASRVNLIFDDARLAGPRAVAPAMLFGRRKDAWELRPYSFSSWVVANGLGGTFKPRPHLAERLNSLFTQSDGIALSSPGKLDDRFGYNCHCGIIAIDRTQLTQCIFERHCEHRDSVRPKDFLFSLDGVRN